MWTSGYAYKQQRTNMPLETQKWIVDTLVKQWIGGMSNGSIVHTYKTCHWVENLSLPSLCNPHFHRYRRPDTPHRPFTPFTAKPLSSTLAKVQGATTKVESDERRRSDSLSIQEWYPKFKSVSTKTIIHELPETFVEYLIGGSRPLILPQSIYGDDALPGRTHNPLDEEDFQVQEGSEDESKQLPQPPCFPELELAVKESIQNLGGAVMPKLNWSSPKDATWISTSETFCCTSFSEIVLLLRSSDSLVNDLCHAFDSCIDKTSSRPPTFFLALRKWYPSFHPEMEFRCFVQNHILVGIFQREFTGFYPVLLEKMDGLETLIQEFFVQNLQDKFESKDYAFDVYVKREERVKLVDYNPWGAFTLPLLFSWEELEDEVEGNKSQFRIVESQCAVQPGLKTAVRYDYLDTSKDSGWDQFLKKAEEELRSQDTSPEAGC